MEYRCPKHDLIFQAVTDMRRPGSVGDKKFADHPVNGHPDCPKCQEEKDDGKASSSTSTSSDTGTGTSGTSTSGEPTDSGT